MPFGMEVIADSGDNPASRENRVSLHCLSAWRSLLTSMKIKQESCRSVCLHCLSAWRSLLTGGHHHHVHRTRLLSSLPFGMEVIADERVEAENAFDDIVSSLPFGMEVIADATPVT